MVAFSLPLITIYNCKVGSDLADLKEQAAVFENFMAAQRKKDEKGEA